MRTCLRLQAVQYVVQVALTILNSSWACTQKSSMKNNSHQSKSVHLLFLIWRVSSAVTYYTCCLALCHCHCFRWIVIITAFAYSMLHIQSTSQQFLASARHSAYDHMTITAQSIKYTPNPQSLAYAVSAHSRSKHLIPYISKVALSLPNDILPKHYFAVACRKKCTQQHGTKHFKTSTSTHAQSEPRS